MKTAEEKTLEKYKAQRSALVQELDLLNNLISLMENRMAVYGSCLSKDPITKTFDDSNHLYQTIDTSLFPIKKKIKIKTIDSYKFCEPSVKKTSGYFSNTETFFNLYSHFASTYRKTMTYNEKIVFVLGRIKSATVYEMMEMLKIYEQPEDEEKLFSGLTMAASAMNVKGEIFAQKQGRRNKYSLQPFEEVKDESLLKFMSLDVNRGIEATVNFKDEDEIF